jgi:hypothetical protein
MRYKHREKRVAEIFRVEGIVGQVLGWVDEKILKKTPPTFHSCLVRSNTTKV